MLLLFICLIYTIHRNLCFKSQKFFKQNTYVRTIHVYTFLYYNTMKIFRAWADLLFYFIFPFNKKINDNNFEYRHSKRKIVQKKLALRHEF